MFEFLKTKKSVKKEIKKKAPLSDVGKMFRESRFEGIIIRPHYTEKSSKLSEGRVYAFEVFPNATKRNIASAIEQIYKVKPDSVRIVSAVKKKTSLRKYKGGLNYKNINKKAYVKLREGDTISFS